MSTTHDSTEAAGAVNAGDSEAASRVIADAGGHHPLAAAPQQSESESSHEKAKGESSVSSGLEQEEEERRRQKEAMENGKEGLDHFGRNPATGEQEEEEDDGRPRGAGQEEGGDEATKEKSSKRKRRMSRAGSVPDFLKPTPKVQGFTRKVYSFLGNNLNFYRIHLTVFTLTPLVFSAIFWASNTTEIKYIDCLFVCVSAMTVTGLTTINLSISTPWQQAILFFLMCIGNLSAVSIVMVLIRRHFFRLKFDDVIRKSAKARKRMEDVEVAHQKERRKELIRLQRLVGLRRKRQHGHRKRRHDEGDEESDEHHDDSPHSTPQGERHRRIGGFDSSRSTASTDSIASAELRAERKKKATKQKKGPLRADMIKRMDQPAVLINPMGMPSTAVREKTPEWPQDESQQQTSSIARSPSMRLGNSTNGGGGILNSGGAEAGGGEDQQTPNVRIAIPEGSQRRRSTVTVESPEELRTDPNLLSPSSYIHDDHETAGHRFSSDASRNRRRGSIPPFRTAGDSSDESHVPRSAEPHRTRFSESVLADDGGEAAAASADVMEEVEEPRRPSRRTSDPTRNGQLHFHARHGSDVGAMRPLFTRPAPDFPRAQTVEFSEPKVDRERRSFHPDRAATTSAFSPNAGAQSLGVGQGGGAGLNANSLRNRVPTLDFERTPTMRSAGQGGYGYGYGRRSATSGVPMTRTQTTSKERGFGGFPTPFDVAGFALKKALPQLQERFTRSTTMPRTATFASTYSATGTNMDPTARSAPYLSFDATVSRNSRFHELTETQRDELGGVEYRAIDLLSKLLPAYWFGVNLFMVVLVAPWLASASAVTVHRVFAEQGATAPGTTWFWFFQVISAYSNTGFSLIDTSMIQMADQYLMLIPIGILILAGNTAFPIFLRFFIWVISCCVPKSSRVYETLRFLLDHPRRCFVYLFPSAQTWFLLLVLVILNSTDWIFFQILDIGNPVIEAWSVGQRTFDGLFQSIAVRAAGFQIISLLELAPAVQFLYIVMMYISAYPIAMSVRNTNVYEERSLGIYNDKEETPPAYDDGTPSAGGARVWGTYLAAHARRQLAFDIWWLGFALWLICVIEKTNIEDPSSNGWFTVFSCLFELTSAYGTVGLSTGTPYDNFSLSGRFSTLSKLVVIAVMLRGRHRGLPVAIDRAILLPSDLEYEDDINGADLVIVDESGNMRSRNTFAATTMSQSNYYPRTATGNMTAGYTPRTMRGRSQSLERTPSRLDLDGEDAAGGGGGYEDKKDLSYIIENTQEDVQVDHGYGEEKTSREQHRMGEMTPHNKHPRLSALSGSGGGAAGGQQHHYLSAITESTPSLVPSMSRANSSTNPEAQQQPNKDTDAGGEGSSSHGCSNGGTSNDSKKGKARDVTSSSPLPQQEQRESPPPPFETATRIESLQSNAIDDSSSDDEAPPPPADGLTRREQEYRQRYGST